MSTTVSALESRLARYLGTCQYPVALAYLFGSQARGGTTPFSDVDVAVYLARPDDGPDRAERVQMYLPLLAELRQITPKADLIYINDASPLLGHRIVRDGKLLYARDEKLRVALEARLLQRYFDHQVFYAVRERYLRQRIRKGQMGQGDVAMIDHQAMKARLHYIDEMIGLLRERAKQSKEALAADPRSYHAALYELQTSLEAVTDIAAHLVAALNLGKPEERSDLPRILAEADIIPQPLADALAQALGMRNILVHGYLQVAGDIVYQSLQENLNDLESFSAHILNYLDKSETTL